MKKRGAERNLTIAEMKLVDPAQWKERGRHELSHVKGKQGQDHQAIASLEHLDAQQIPPTCEGAQPHGEPLADAGTATLGAWLRSIADQLTDTLWLGAGFVTNIAQPAQVVGAHHRTQKTKAKDERVTHLQRRIIQDVAG